MISQKEGTKMVEGKLLHIPGLGCRIMDANTACSIFKSIQPALSGLRKIGVYLFGQICDLRKMH